MWCSEPDAELWYGQARHVSGLVRSAWNALVKIETDKGESTHTTALETPTTAYETGFDALPEPSVFMAFGAFDCAEAVQQYIGNIRQGACVLEQLNAALQSYGAGEVDPGAADSGWIRKNGGWLIGGVAVVALGTTVWFAFGRPAMQQRRALRALGRA